MGVPGNWALPPYPGPMGTVDVMIHVPVGSTPPPPETVREFYRDSGFTEAAMSVTLPGHLIPTKPVLYTLSVDEAAGE